MHEYVLRFDIPVHEALAVHDLQGQTYLGEPQEALFLTQAMFPHVLGKVTMVRKFEH